MSTFTELGRVIEALSKERGISKEVVVKAVEQAFVVTARKKFGIQGEYEAKYNESDDDIEIFQYKNVVESVRDGITDIALNDALALDPEAQVGDQLGIKVENLKFTRVDVQTVRQVIFQKVRDAEREILFSEFKHREGEIVTGIARRYEKGNVIVDLGKADAILPRREIIMNETFKQGDRIQAYLSEVVMTNHGPEIRLSRTSPLFLVKLFEMEVPEIVDGTIEVKSAAREPGHRAKIAVFSADREIDPVGACVGMKGSRVQNIVNELQGEKIDIVRWSPEISEFSKAALAPAEITNMMFNHEERSIDVVVEEDQLSLAIGRRGQNVRLAAMLTGYKINIISKAKLQTKIKKSVENLMQVSAIADTRAQMLVQAGVMSLGDLCTLNAEELSQMIKIDVSQAQEMLDKTHEMVDAGSVQLVVEEEGDFVSASAVPAYDGSIDPSKAATTGKDAVTGKFSEAEKRLREELAAFKLK